MFGGMYVCVFVFMVVSFVSSLSLLPSRSLYDHSDSHDVFLCVLFFVLFVLFIRTCHIRMFLSLLSYPYAYFVVCVVFFVVSFYMLLVTVCILYGVLFCVVRMFICVIRVSVFDSITCLCMFICSFTRYVYVCSVCVCVLVLFIVVVLLVLSLFVSLYCSLF